MILRRSRQLCFLVSALLVLANAQPPTAPPAGDDGAREQKEQMELNQAVNEAANSAIDLVHAFERHLAKYPDSKQREAIENALARNAMELNDSARILLYGEKVLARETPDDPSLIDRVIRTLLDDRDSVKANRALAYVKRYEGSVQALRLHAPADHLTAAQWAQQLDRIEARVLVLEARATGYLDHPEEALKIARNSWAAWPTADGAREIGYWLTLLKRNAEAIEYYADAFTIEDPRSTNVDRVNDRRKLGELYTQPNGSEKGLGDVILAAYDRTSGIMNERIASLKAKDPNAVATNIMEYRLPGLVGAEPLTMATLKGKTVVMDFWATWCVPCRAQHPILEKVRKRFESAPDVVFLAVDADDDPSVVPAFLKEAGWTGTYYFEAGLTRQLTIGSIPTVLILDPTGAISSRMAGFNPERFEELLVARIEEARKANSHSATP